MPANQPASWRGAVARRRIGPSGRKSRHLLWSRFPRQAAPRGTASRLGRLSLYANRRQPPPLIDDLWYKNSVIYCLSVGTYMDANGDGVGDFKGLSRRLDYLHGLGITTIWLMPFQPSPRKDDGYDISDYYCVDPRHGTLGDFVEFTHGCKQRGIRVIIDLVVNHTSNEHAWFKSARSKDSRSP